MAQDPEERQVWGPSVPGLVRYQEGIMETWEGGNRDVSRKLEQSLRVQTV